MPTQPLYASIAENLALDIGRGLFPLGALLPTEIDLAQQLNVSRATVRAALTRLEARGLVSRRKNVGTRVEAQQSQRGYGTQLNSLGDLLHWAKACRRHVQAAETLLADKVLAQELSVSRDSAWLKLTSLRFDGHQDSEPVALTFAYIDQRYASLLGQIKRQTSALISQLLEKQFGLDLAVIEQTIQGAKLDKGAAHALRASNGEAALRVIRRYLTPERQVVLVTVSIHPASRYEVNTRLTRS